MTVDEHRYMTLIARDTRIIKKGGELLSVEYLQ
jgi:hypothetical protein